MRLASLLAATSLGAAALVLGASCSLGAFCRDGDVGCAADPCRDRERDGDETDVDCGGSCAPCADALACREARDCAGGRCFQGACCAPPCVAWSKSFGGEGVDRVSRALVLDDGTVVLAGVFGGTADLGDGPRKPAGGTDVFVTALAKDGSTRWVRTFGGEGEEASPRLALAPDGHLWLGTTFNSPTLDTGAGIVDGLGEGLGQILLLVELDAAGQSLRAKSFPGAGSDVALLELAATADGGVLVAGDLGAIDFGDGTKLTAANDPTIGDRNDVFVARLDDKLDRVWSRLLGDVNRDSLAGASLDAAGDVVLLATSETNTDYGGPKVAGPGAIVAKYAGKDGAHLWSRSLGAGFAPERLALDASDDIFLAADLQGIADLGTGKLAPRGTSDALLARLDPTGATVWVETVPSSVETHALSIYATHTGGLLAAVRLTGTLAPDAGVSTPLGVDSLVLLHLDQDGRFTWAKNVGGIVFETPANFADAPGGLVLAYGGYEGTLDLGGVEIARGHADAFAAEFLP